jgi:regulator of protease activity HflC (stomatin/prohibitin superfamily)
MTNFDVTNMSKSQKINVGIIALILVSIITFFTVFNVKFIDSGYTGVKIKLYGSNKGVEGVTAVTGMTVYNRFLYKVIETPTKNIVTKWTYDDTEGSPNNDEFVLTTKDGLPVKMDVSANWKVLPTNAATIYMEYRETYDVVANTVLRDYIRSAYNRVAAEYTAEELYNNRVEFENKANQQAIMDLGEENFTIEKTMILKDIRPPETILNAIESKVEAEQSALRKVQEQQQERADSLKLVIRKGGEAEAKRIEADAIRYYNEQVQQSLTEGVLMQKFIDRWDGTYGTGNVFGEGVMMFKNVGN